MKTMILPGRASRHPAMLLPVLILLLGAATAVSAFGQSANDGFDPDANGQVRTVAIQADGRIILGGTFTTLGGNVRTNLARINVDGSVDPTFHPHPNNPVDCLALQPDGRILVGGGFTLLGGLSRSRIGRLNPDGSVDESFNPGANSFVQYLALQPDGRILVGGQFAMLGNQPRSYLGRLMADGSLDASFNPALNNNGNVYRVIVQPNGRILVGGSFTQINGQARNYLARLTEDGTVESGFNPGADFPVRGLVLQPDGKILVGGYFTRLGGQPRCSLGRLNADGSLDRTFNPGANNTVQSFALQSDGRILVGGSLTTLGGQTHNRMGRLNADGSPDTSFATQVGGTASPFVYALALQADGKIVVGGIFTNLNGLPRNYIGRLYSDGTVETPFAPAASNYAMSLAVQPDGKILAGGLFTNLAGQACNRLGRLNPDGSLDSTFGFGVGADNVVRTMVVQPDRKIVVGGFFTSLAGQSRIHIGRLNADGSLDTAFNPSTDAGLHPVYGMALQPDGKLVVAGQFTMLGGQPRSGIGRLNPDGSVDPLFNPGANGYVLSLALQGDGKILVGGVFSTLGGQPHNRIGRLTADGSIDSTFRPSADNMVEALLVQPDGKVLVAGYFNALAGQPRSYIGRLNADGTLDGPFNPGANGTVFCVALQPDGRILVGGNFTMLGGANRNHIGRLNADGTVDDSFNPGANSIVLSLAVQVDGSVIASGFFSTLGGQPREFFGRLTSGGAALQELAIDAGGTTATWNRSGTGPERQPVTIAQSLDGANYAGLGTASRIPGGWQLSGLALPAGQNFYLRARGLAPVSYNSSSGLIESVRQFYLSIRLKGIAQLVDGNFALDGVGAGGQAYVLLAAGNLLSTVMWMPVATNTADGNGVVSLSDLLATNLSQRFYRIKPLLP